MHDAELREKAFHLWMEGHSYEDVARLCDVSKQTVVRMSKGNKRFKELPWKIRRQRVTEQVQRKADDNLADRRTKLVAQVRKVRNSIWKQVMEREVGSAEGGVHALVSLIRMEMTLTGDKPSNETEVIERTIRSAVPKTILAVCDFLSESDDIKKLIDARKSELVSNVMDAMLRITGEELRQE